eukprot:6964459-Alexandrium_andersonii.AAC.1
MELQESGGQEQIERLKHVTKSGAVQVFPLGGEGANALGHDFSDMGVEVGQNNQGMPFRIGHPK